MAGMAPDERSGNRIVRTARTSNARTARQAAPKGDGHEPFHGSGGSGCIAQHPIVDRRAAADRGDVFDPHQGVPGEEDGKHEKRGGKDHHPCPGLGQYPLGD
jgi:hypothetical protein